MAARLAWSLFLLVGACTFGNNRLVIRAAIRSEDARVPDGHGFFLQSGTTRRWWGQNLSRSSISRESSFALRHIVDIINTSYNTAY